MNEDIVNKFSPYTDNIIKIIEYIECEKLGFNLGSAITCISRSKREDTSKAIEDLKKAVWHIERTIKWLEKFGPEPEVKIETSESEDKDGKDYVIDFSNCNTVRDIRITNIKKVKEVV